MWKGRGMRNSLQSAFSEVAAAASTTKKLLPFRARNAENNPLSSSVKKSCQGEKRPLAAVKTTPGQLQDRKRGAAPSQAPSLPGSNGSESPKLLMRTPSRSKKPTTTPQHGNRLQEGPNTTTKARHYRQSQSLHNINTSSDRSSVTLRQSASFSAGITNRRPSTSCSSTPRGKLTRHQGSLPRGASRGAFVTSSSRRCVIASGQAARNEIELDSCCNARGNNVRVFIRARPVSDAEVRQSGKLCIRHENAHTVAWLGQPETRFTFDHVADEFVSQAELFQVVGLPMVDNCIAGYNSCMFAYGQTGSGKTHTMLGDIEHLENRGMTPRVFEYLFAKIRKEEEAQKQRKLKYKCRCSFLEIFNEQISDLLEPSSTNLPMREDGKKGVFVEGLLEDEVRSVQDVLDLLLLGATNRRVAATNMNRESSRSHSVFTCVIESQWECDSVINYRYCRLNLVDLAGSERQKDTGVDEERLREAASINKSLSTLGLVIMVLVDIANGKQRHVPYRDSKLTFLLQDSLGGNSKTTIIANISPSSRASSETLSTLKFAQRAKFIQNNAVINEEGSGDAKGLQAQIQQLKDELALVRRQSASRIASNGRSSGSLKGSLSSTNYESTCDTKDISSSAAQGSFLHFGRAAPSPTVLNRKVESCRRDLAECRAKLETSLHSNAKIASELDAMRTELESSRDECRKQKQELEDLQLKKALEDNGLEVQHQEVLLELKTQLQKSNEKAEQEVIKRRQIELQLREALQESTNLQTELKWTRDSLEEAESIMETFQRPEAVLPEIGDPDAAYEASVIGQLQTEIIEMHGRLEEERRRRAELERQIKSNNSNDDLSEHDYSVTTEIVRPCNAGKGKRIKIKHQDAILQLQMELDSVSEPQGGIHSKELQLEIEELETQLLEEKARNDDRLLWQQQLPESNLTHEDLEALKIAENSAAKAIIGVKELWKANQQEWEGAALRMFDYLVKKLPERGVVFEDQSLPQQDFLAIRLRHARSLVNSAEEKLQAISDLALNSIRGSCFDTNITIMEVVLETRQNMKNLGAYDGKLRGLEQRLGVALIMEWWMAEVSRFRPSEAAFGVASDERKGELRGEKELLEIQVESSIEVLENLVSEINETEENLQQVLDVRIAGESDKKQAGRANFEEELEAAQVRVRDLQHQIELQEAEIIKLEHQATEGRRHWILEKSKLLTAIQESESKTQSVAKQENPETDSTDLLVQRNGVKDCTRPLTIPRRALAELHSACSEPEKLWNSVTTEPFTTSKIVVLPSCEELNNNFPSAGRVEIQLTRTTYHVLLLSTATGSEANTAKLLSEMFAKIQENNNKFASPDHLEARDSVYDETSTNAVSSLAWSVQRELNILKALVLSLDTENADLQHQILETEANSTALKSTVSNLQRELQETTRQNSETMAQLRASERHIFKLECETAGLKDSMKRQSVAFAVLYEQLQKQESLQTIRKETQAELLAEFEESLDGIRDLKEKAELERMQALRQELTVPVVFSEPEVSYALRETVERTAAEREREEMLRSQFEREMRGLEKKVEEKQVEVEILGKSVEELENTVFALESQVGLLKREGDRQRLVREDLESDLLALQHQNAIMHATTATHGGGVRRESYADRCGARSWRNTKLWVLKKMLPFPIPRTSLRSERKLPREARA